MITRSLPSIRPSALAVMAVVVAALGGTTACSGLSLPGATYDKTQAYEFSDLGEANADQILPSWVPEDAREIKEVQRTTGHERIFTLTLDGPLPDSCLPVATPGRPSAEEIARAMAQESSLDEEQAARLIEDQHHESLLTAGWWPQGAERETTHLCGKWWVSQRDGQVLAFTPETRVIAEGVLAERAAR